MVLSRALKQGAQQGAHGTARFLEGFLEGSFQEVNNRSAPKGRQQMGEQVSAKLCGFLRKSAVSCGFLRKSAPPKSLDLQSEPKISENLQKSAKMSVPGPVSPFCCLPFGAGHGALRRVLRGGGCYRRRLEGEALRRCLEGRNLPFRRGRPLCVHPIKVVSVWHLWHVLQAASKLPCRCCTPPTYQCLSCHAVRRVTKKGQGQYLKATARVNRPHDRLTDR